MPDWRRTLVWHDLEVPLQPKAETVEAALRALATLSHQPLVVLEASGQGGMVSWRLGARRLDVPRVLAALKAHLGGAALVCAKATRMVAPDVVASVRYLGAGPLPLRDELSPSVIRSVLGVLAGARRQEAVHLQLVLGPRRQPSQSRQSRRPDRSVALKQAEFRFQLTVRLAATSPDERRAQALVQRLAGSLRLLESPGVHLRLTRGSTADFIGGKAPWFWSNTLSTTDLVPLTAWPVGDHPLPGIRPPHPRRLPVPPSVPRAGRVLGYGALDTDRAVALSEADALRHLHLLGPTGVGKSTVMANLIVADMQAGRGVILIDPKGDLVDDVLARVPASRSDDVVVLDPLDDAPVGLNPLTGDPDLSADTLLAIFHQLYADNWGPRTHDILHASLLTLARRGDASLVLIPLLLTNPGFRRSVIGAQVKADPMGLGTFWAWFDGISEAERQTAIAPLMNKLRPILLRPGIRSVLGQRHPTLSMQDIFAQRRILLVSLSKGRLGPEAAQLLGALVVGMVWNAALERAAGSTTRPTTMLHIDEVQDYLRLPGDLSDALAQGRSLGLGLTLAHQALAQLPGPIREAVLANARSRLTFALSPRDARDIAGTTLGQLRADDFQSLPAFTAYASLLSAGTASDWFMLRTRPLPPATGRSAELRARSRASFGRARTDIDADLAGLIDPPTAGDEPLGRTARRRP